MKTGGKKIKPTGEPEVLIEAMMLLIAIGQGKHFFSLDSKERDLGWSLINGECQLSIPHFASTFKRCFFGGDAALGPKNIITVAAQPRSSIDLHGQKDSNDRSGVRPGP